MTECPKCKGYGIIGSAVPDILRGRGAIFSSNECDMCHGSGEVPMTNEEWLHTLNTEEKAFALETIIRSVLVLRSPMCHDVCNRKFWERWLKEIHDDNA